jgi:hypothetical protein
MSDIALRTNTDLMAFTEEAGQVHKIAQALATTSFVPASMKGKPDEITGAILFGRELGMNPMTALQTINVIQGRPTLSANAMRGLAMAAGVVFRLDEATNTRCTVSARTPGGEWTTVTWGIEQAKQLGLLVKDNWKNQPGAMLIARATSQLCRFVAANILIGMPYSAEELRDLPSETATAMHPEPPERKTRTMRLKQEAPAEEPELVPEPVADNEMLMGAAAVNNTPAYTQPAQKEIGYSQVDDEKRISPEGPVERPDMVTTKTRTALMAAFNDRRIRDRATRLASVSEILGREVFTINQVTEMEARHILDTLNGWPPVEVPAS